VGLTRIAINRPLTILMFILGLVIMGGVSFGLLKVDRMPAISAPFVNVSVSYSGAAPQDIEDLVIRPVEQAVSGIAGIDTVESDSNEGRGSVRIQFVEGWDADKGAIDVDRKMASILNRLPADASAPTVNKMDPNSQPIMNVSLTGQLPIDELYNLAANAVQPRLQSVPGVADVSISGGLVREVRVLVSYTKLSAFGIAPSTITSAMTRENINQPGGSVNVGSTSLNIRTQGLYQSADELANMIVANTTAGPVYLRDVATVNEGFKDRSSYQRFNGQESVGISITKTSEANSLQVANDLRTALSNIGSTFPSSVKMVISNDSSRYTQSALDAIKKDLSLAVLLCGAVLLLFLHAWRSTLIVILAIPTSLVTTFLVMFATGMTLNTISMMALALTIGILVDDSIVVLENIHRHLKLGEPRREAALNGRSEIGLAAMAITLVDVVVYLPVAFMQGMIGQMFKEYGLTIASATLISLFVSFTLTPMLASKWLKEEKGEDESQGSSWNPLVWFPAWWERGYNKVANGYGGLLRLALRARPLVVLIAIVAFSGAMALPALRILGIEYAPTEDDSQLNVNISMATGTSLDASNAATRQIESQILQMPEVANVFTTVRGSTSGGGFGPGGGSSISLQLVDKSERQRTASDIANQIRRMGQSIPGATVRANVSSSMGGGGGGGGGGVRVDMMGPDLDVLKGISSQMEQVARGVPGIVDVRPPDFTGIPEVRAVLDRRKMAEMGVTATQVSQTVRTMLQGSVADQLQPENRDQMDITIIANDTDRTDMAKLETIPIITGTGTTVKLGQVAKLVNAFSPQSISHSSRQRVISLSATVDGRPLSDVSNDVREAVKKANLPLGYSIVVGGSVRQMDTAMAALQKALSLSIVLIYMLLVALYESWLQPLTIMLALPVSLIGAFGGLWVTGNTLNIFSMIGMIMLMGLVAKNAILLVDYTNTLRARGVSRTEAIVESGRTRLRPILMTTSTIICSMIPLALKLEAGAESRSPMAVVVIGGVISSTLLTLVLVPCVYTYMDDLQTALGNPNPLWFLHRAKKPALQPVRVEDHR
jgi:hydrophobic/amphiphilic exporter-1 (mainly G- bacteria), HAE1 family